MFNRLLQPALITIVGASSLVFANTVQAASQTWDGGGDGTRFSDPLNWSGDAIPGSDISTATNTTNNNVATITVPESLALNIQFDTYRSLGQFRFDGAGDVRLFGFATDLPVVDDDTGPTGSTTSFRLNGADLFDTIRVEDGNVLIEGDDTSTTAAIRFGRFNNNWYVEDGSTLTFDVTMGFVNSASTITKNGLGTGVFKGDSGNTGGGGASATQATWTIAQGKIRAESPSAWRGSSNSAVDIADGAMLELVNASNSGINRTFTLRGSGIGGLGALYASGGGESIVLSTSGSTGVTGQLILASDTSIGVESGSVLTLAHGIDGANSFGTLTKTGPGTLVFRSNNELPYYGYAGAVTVSQGTLLVNSQATTQVLSGGINTGGSNDRTIVLNDNSSVTVGQLVSGPGVNPGTFVTVVSETSGNATLSQLLNSATETFGDFTFDGITSALNTSPVTVQTGGTLGGTGSINGSTVTVDSGGSLAPGASIGAFGVGSATVNGTLNIEFGGNRIDQLDVAGTLDITNTTLDFSGIGTITNGEYIFATYDTLQGSNFAGVSNLPASFTLHHDTVNKYFSVMVTGKILHPDHNADGKVDAADYVWWRKHENSPEGYDLWRANFGNPPGSGSSLDAGGSVPEPAAFVLVGWIVACLGASRRALSLRKA
jgi:autotransporter-associated beta strand protein